MTTFKIINSLLDWEMATSEFNNLDIYYSYQYGKTSANEENGDLFAAYYSNEGSKLFYPFIKRKVEIGNEKLNDIITPYGYGGPIVEGESKKIVVEFYNKFKYYCLTNNIITETVRFHPIINNATYCGSFLNCKYIRKTTAVDLNKTLEEIRNNYSSMNKRNIKKAKKEGVTCIKAESTEENMNIFISLYKQTMKKNKATSFYYFDKSYFSEQMNKTSMSETILLFAMYKNEIIAAVMVIIGKTNAHYHLGASNSEFLNLKPNNLLFDFMIEYCKLNGSSVLHLGGGYKEDDGLFKFKSSFTNNNNYDYYIGTKIYNHDIYREIENDIKQTYHTNEYFPIYRGELIEKQPELLVEFKVR
ncbi:lipid II:glycine glycyltransferase FemX [Salipaludibacillus daqingensis]|uniref:lipid II:glycine glycyltransferase FemX n=1 Tax=Salipaludibacillus daqingensis TaxID=3041001 RepID=UPI002475378E|nr:peptidoglycan bridge formation glycyltransferase FemA/FemB family protein [Salipaludibacillus daqingensis]